MARRQKGNATRTEAITVSSVTLVLVAVAALFLDGLAAIVLAAIAVGGLGIALALTVRRNST